MRKAIVSGQFYEHDSEKLRRQLKELFKGTRQYKKKVYGIISPHAGYYYSGKAAAAAFGTLSDEPDTFVILGPNHHSLANSVSFEDFETPLGISKNDIEFSKEISRTISNDENAHRYEHSIEVQLPFIQYLFSDVKIVPIVIGSQNYDECMGIADEIVRISKKLKRKICVVASSDFTHYGSAYNFVPFSKNIIKNLYELDNNAIKLIEKMDSFGFYKYSQKTTICGTFPIIIAIEVCKSLGAKKAEKMMYYNSSDISKDYNAAVGYAAIVFV